MTGSRASSILLFAGTLAVALLIGGVWFARLDTGSDNVSAPPAVEITSSEPAGEVSLEAPSDVLLPTESAAPESRVVIPRTRLSVMVVNEAGEAISADLSGTGPQESKLDDRTTPSRPVRWNDAPVGTWRIEAEAEGYLTKVTIVRLRTGEVNNLEITLTESELVSGRITDRFGSPVALPIWFLHEDQRHPRFLDEVESLLSIRPDRHGLFTYTPPTSDWYQLSVGPVGRTDGRMLEPVYIEVGKPRNVHIVLNEGTRIELRVEGMPQYSTAPENAVTAFILEKPGTSAKEIAREERRAERDAEKRARIVEQAARHPEDKETSDERLQRHDARVASRTERAQRALRSDASWPRRRTVDLPPDGMAVVAGLQPGAVYRLALRYGDLSFESSHEFSPDEESVLEVIATLPPLPRLADLTGEARADAQLAAKAAGLAPIPTRIDLRLNDTGTPPPGFHWK
ncbi:MAG: hypothetical protein GY711_07015 [bacterium]|nr:hypothetical protein [bacterium]